MKKNLVGNLKFIRQFIISFVYTKFIKVLEKAMDIKLPESTKELDITLKSVTRIDTEWIFLYFH